MNRTPSSWDNPSCASPGANSESREVRRNNAGITLIELLVVLGIIGVLVLLGAIAARGILGAQEERAAVRSIQQSIWQGATAASARGRNTELVQLGRDLIVREAGTGVQIRAEQLPSGVIVDMPSLVFTPPGKISETSYAAVRDGVTIIAGDRTVSLRVSIIGEAVVEEAQ